MINNNGLSGLFFIIVTIILIYLKCKQSLILTTLLLSITTLLYHSSQKKISKEVSIIDKSNLYKFLIHKLDTILANFMIIHLLVNTDLPINIQIALSILCAYNTYFRFFILIFLYFVYRKKLDVKTIILILLSLMTFFTKKQTEWNCYQRIMWHFLTALLILNNANNFDKL